MADPIAHHSRTTRRIRRLVHFRRGLGLGFFLGTGAMLAAGHALGVPGEGVLFPLSLISMLTYAALAGSINGRIDRLRNALAEPEAPPAALPRLEGSVSPEGAPVPVPVKPR